MGYEPHLSAGLQLLSEAELSGYEVQHPHSQAGGWSGQLKGTLKSTFVPSPKCILSGGKKGDRSAQKV